MSNFSFKKEMTNALKRLTQLCAFDTVASFLCLYSKSRRLNHFKTPPEHPILLQAVTQQPNAWKDNVSLLSLDAFVLR